MDEVLKRLERIEALLQRPDVGTRRPRVVVCTQAEFDRLPALVGRREFMEWTGYNRSELAQEVRAGRIKVYRPDGVPRARYFKSEIARLGGFRF